MKYKTFQLKNKPIDIFLITYNRAEKLKRTLSSILSINSPVRNYNITIIDNNSTDNTPIVIKEFQNSHSNIKYIHQKRNIGGNANIIDCFRLASNRYFWILCDDDEYDWKGWDEVEDAITRNFDVIMTKRLYNSTNIPIDIIANELTFVPGAIYKTSLITSDVIQVAYYNLYTSFPHFAIIAKAINENRRFYVIRNKIVTQGADFDPKTYTRGVQRFVHPRQKNTNLILGYVLSFRLIKNKKIRYRAYNHLYLGKGFSRTVWFFLKTNRNCVSNLILFLLYISFFQKIQFTFILAYYYLFPQFEVRNKKIYCRFFGAKIKILSLKH